MRRRKNDPSVEEVLSRLEDLGVRITRLEENQKWVREMLMKLEGRMWALLAGVVLSVLSAIVGAVVA